MKRSIGHLCHDEPRESTKKLKGEHGNTGADGGSSHRPEDDSTARLDQSLDQRKLDKQLLQEAANSHSPANSSNQPQRVPSTTLRALDAGRAWCTWHSLPSLFIIMH